MSLYVDWNEVERGILLRKEREARRVSPMTTNPDTEYRIIQLVAGIIEDSYEKSSIADPKSLAKAYVRNVLDNGWISSMDDTPVWELIELLGYDRDDMDNLAVYHRIAELIEENDFFND